ncbi:hypothetical protein HDE_13884 [Halotydeus destructor]|nr:hypothetical protein HDE_13884 [Halotydeus destructor]
MATLCFTSCLLTVCASLAAAVSLKECRTWYTEAQACSNNLFSWNSVRVNDTCHFLRQNVDCVAKYTNCTQVIDRVFLINAEQRLRHLVDYLCIGSELMLMEQHRKCYEQDARYELHTSFKTVLLNQLSAGLDYARKANETQVFAAVCCSFAFFHERMKDNVKGLCFDLNGSDSLEFTDRVNRKLIDSIIEMDCESYETIKKCHYSAPAEKSHLEAIFKRRTIKQSNESFLFVLMQIINDNYM